MHHSFFQAFLHFFKPDLFFVLFSPSSLCSSSASHSHAAFGFFVSPLSLTTCLYFLPTSDLQMNCMLRSWSTRPLVRSWTMPLMTWHLCRCADIFLCLPLTSLCSCPVLWIHILSVDHTVCVFFPSLYAGNYELKKMISYFPAFVSLVLYTFVKSLMHNLSYVVYVTMHFDFCN